MAFVHTRQIVSPRLFGRTGRQNGHNIHLLLRRLNYIRKILWKNKTKFIILPTTTIIRCALPYECKAWTTKNDIKRTPRELTSDDFVNMECGEERSIRSFRKKKKKYGVRPGVKKKNVIVWLRSVFTPEGTMARAFGWTGWQYDRNISNSGA